MPESWQHPFLTSGRDLDKGIAVGIHGDDASVFRKVSVLILSMHGVCPQEFHHLSHLLLSMISYDDVVPVITLNELYRHIAHDLKWAYQGIFPPVDADGNAWPTGSAQQRNAGLQIGNGFRLVLVQQEGGWKFHKVSRNHSNGQARIRVWWPVFKARN
eukprot:8572271-Alexandrium_andersonii.AAC.1